MADDQGAQRKSARVQGLSPAQRKKVSPGIARKTRGTKGEGDSAKKKLSGETSVTKKGEGSTSGGGASARKASNIQKAPDGSLIYKRRSSVGSRSATVTPSDKEVARTQTPTGRMHGTRLSTGSLKESPSFATKSDSGPTSNLRKRSTSHDSEQPATHTPPSPKKRKLGRVTSNQSSESDWSEFDEVEDVFKKGTRDFMSQLSLDIDMYLNDTKQKFNEGEEILLFKHHKLLKLEDCTKNCCVNLCERETEKCQVVKNLTAHKSREMKQVDNMTEPLYNVSPDNTERIKETGSPYSYCGNIIGEIIEVCSPTKPPLNGCESELSLVLEGIEDFEGPYIRQCENILKLYSVPSDTDVACISTEKNMAVEENVSADEKLSYEVKLSKEEKLSKEVKLSTEEKVSDEEKLSTEEKITNQVKVSTEAKVSVEEIVSMEENVSTEEKVLTEETLSTKEVLDEEKVSPEQRQSTEEENTFAEESVISFNVSPKIKFTLYKKVVPLIQENEDLEEKNAQLLLQMKEIKWTSKTQQLYERHVMEGTLQHSLHEDNSNDFYCWQCHGEGRVVCCELCPRVFHSKCLGIEKEPTDEWVCPECEKVMRAECVDTRSKAMSLITIDQLCLLLKYGLQRMKCQGSEPFQKPVDVSQFPNYSEYVFHPVDLAQLEKNIKKKMYGSTDSFLADAKWILHNCIIFNGKHNKLTSVAKTIIKIAKHEMNEIEICPDCYFNSCTKRGDNWFCEPCRVPHPLVWAKMRGYPFWPAKALRVVKDQVDCRFFGEHDRAWVHVSSVFLLSEECPVLAKKKTHGFDQSMEELNVHINRIKDKFGSFEYAPVRTEFDPKQSKLKDGGEDDNMSIKQEDDDSMQEAIIQELPNVSTPDTPESGETIPLINYTPTRGRPRKNLGIGRGGAHHHQMTPGSSRKTNEKSQSVRTALALKSKYSRKSIITTRRGKVADGKEIEEGDGPENIEALVKENDDVISEHSFVNEGVDDTVITFRSESNSPERPIKEQQQQKHIEEVIAVKESSPEKGENDSTGVFITSEMTVDASDAELKSMSLRSGGATKVNPKLPDKTIIDKIEEKVKKLKDGTDTTDNGEDGNTVDKAGLLNENETADTEPDLPKNQQSMMVGDKDEAANANASNTDKPANENKSLAASVSAIDQDPDLIIDEVQLVQGDPKKNPHLFKIVESCKEKLGISDEEEILEKSKDKEDDEEDKEDGEITATSGSGESSSGEESEDHAEPTEQQTFDPVSSSSTNACIYCGKVFDNGRHLEHHVMTAHPPVHPFSCILCNKTFSWRAHAMKHLQKVHAIHKEQSDQFIETSDVSKNEVVKTVIQSATENNQEKQKEDGNQPDIDSESNQSFGSSQSDKLIIDLEDSSEKTKVLQFQEGVFKKVKRSTSPKTGKIVKRKKGTDSVKAKKGEMYKINTGKETLKLSIGQLKMLEAAGKLKSPSWKDTKKAVGEKLTPKRPSTSAEGENTEVQVQHDSIDDVMDITGCDSESDEEIKNYRMEMDKSLDKIDDGEINQSKEEGHSDSSKTVTNNDDKGGKSKEEDEKMDVEKSDVDTVVEKNTQEVTNSSTTKADEPLKEEDKGNKPASELVHSGGTVVEEKTDTAIVDNEASDISDNQVKENKSMDKPMPSAQSSKNSASNPSSTKELLTTEDEKEETEKLEIISDDKNKENESSGSSRRSSTISNGEEKRKEKNRSSFIDRRLDRGSQDDPIPIEDEEDKGELEQVEDSNTNKETTATQSAEENTAKSPDKSKKPTDSKETRAAAETSSKTVTNKVSPVKRPAGIDTITSGVELPNLENLQVDVMEGLTDFSVYTDQMMSSIKQVMESMARDIVAKQCSRSMKTVFLLEMEKLKWKHEQELLEIKHNAAVQMAEMRLCFERSRRKAAEEQQKVFLSDKESAVAETKKKQWCAQCGKEAIFYCCWNTSYCDHLCQHKHWPQHMATCTQSGQQANNDSTSATTTTTTTTESDGVGAAITAAATGSSNAGVVGGSGIDVQQIASNLSAVNTHLKDQVRDSLTAALIRQQQQQISTPHYSTPAITPVSIMPTPGVGLLHQPGSTTQQPHQHHLSDLNHMGRPMHEAPYHVNSPYHDGQFQVQPRAIVPEGNPQTGPLILSQQQQPPILMARRPPGQIDLIRGPVYQPRSY